MSIHSHTGAEKGYIFDTIKEPRDTYYVQYTPAWHDAYFAILAVVFKEEPALQQISDIMEWECKKWMQRYPVPLMVSAFDSTGDVISLNGEMGRNYLIGIRQNNVTVCHWRSFKKAEYPFGALTESQLLDIYHDIPQTTYEERKRKAIASAKSFRLGLFIIALWGVAYWIDKSCTWRSYHYVFNC